MFRVVNTLFCVLLLCAALGSSTAAPAPKKSVAKKSTSAAKSPKRTSSRPKTASSKKPVARRSVTRRSSSKRRSRRVSARHYTRTGQQKPTPERIVEIEAALVRQGFLVGEPDGVWDQNSTAALKLFQERHHIEASGKLTSLSLIALGLGPQRTPIANASLPGTVSGSSAAPTADASSQDQQ